MAASSLYPGAAGGDAACRPPRRRAAPRAAGADRRTVGGGPSPRPAHPGAAIPHGKRAMTENTLLRTRQLSFGYPERTSPFRRAAMREVVKAVDVAVPRGSVL